MNLKVLVIIRLCCTGCDNTAQICTCWQKIVTK